MTDDTRQVASRRAPNLMHYSEIQAQNFSYVPGADDHLRRGRGRRGWLRRGVFLVCLFGLGWAVYDDPSRVGYWWTAARENTAPVIARLIDYMKAPTRPVEAQETVSNDNFTVASSSPSPAPTVAKPVVVASGPAPVNEVAELPADNANDNSVKVIAAVPPVKAIVEPSQSKTEELPKRDPLQVRAKAVGLHSALSPVLLSRLSKTDFQNAGYAIRTALAKTADDKTFKWPTRRKAGLAIFEVRFVPGAAPGCRRYVVTIEKDRWLTTALPLENCKAPTKTTSGPAKS